MEFIKKEPIIFLVAGKARSGKSTVAKIIEEEYSKKNKKVLVTQVTKYLKNYIEEITGNKVSDFNKPRELLQKISSVVIKDKLGMSNFFTDRLLEDLKIYSYFFDVIIVSDVRFESEIEIVKKNFSTAISIGVIRENYESDLSLEEKNDITEVALDNYNGYDYKIVNNNDDLYFMVNDILKDIGSY